MPNALRVDVYVDVICPWCLIGKRQLTLALDMLAQQPAAPDVHLQWHSVQLLPDIPESGLDYAQFYVQRLGSAQAVRARQAQVREAASQAGVAIQFERIQRFPNTRAAHQLLALGMQKLNPVEFLQLLDDVMQAYFQRGEDIGDHSVLLALGQMHGLDPSHVSAWLQSGKGVPEKCSVPGVPYFVFNERIALSGAQSPHVLLGAMRDSLC